jgi:N-acetylglucosaminyldiphosphoundecaprenol N-acetyl-beta-D-mannosaminyltransferase
VTGAATHSAGYVDGCERVFGGSRPPGVPVVRAFGLCICTLSVQEILHWLDQHVLARAGPPVCLFTANVDHVVRCQRDEQFGRFYKEADIVTVDGMWLLWAARLLGHAIAQRVTGIDLVEALCGLAAEKGYGCFFLGAQPESLERMLQTLRQRYPRLHISGWHHGYFQSENEIVDRVAQTDPAILFVGIGSPRQETFLFHHREHLRCRLALPVGGSFDVLSGRVRRAPPWVQRAGCEWLWRLGQEPRRLWRRYLVQDVRFLPIFAREAARSLTACMLQLD